MLILQEIGSILQMWYRKSSSQRKCRHLSLTVSMKREIARRPLLQGWNVATTSPTCQEIGPVIRGLARTCRLVPPGTLRKPVITPSFCRAILHVLIYSPLFCCTNILLLIYVLTLFWIRRFDETLSHHASSQGAFSKRFRSTKSSIPIVACWTTKRPTNKHLE